MLGGCGDVDFHDKLETSTLVRVLVKMKKIFGKRTFKKTAICAEQVPKLLRLEYTEIEEFGFRKQCRKLQEAHLSVHVGPEIIRNEIWAMVKSGQKRLR